MPVPDVLSDIDAVGEYLAGLIGDEDLPGRAANRQRLKVDLVSLKQTASDIVSLESEYASGTTPHQLLERASGSLSPEQTAHLFPQDTGAADKAKIAELEAQLAAMKAGAEAGDGEV
jgi:hypothetical protein